MKLKVIYTDGTKEEFNAYTVDRDDDGFVITIIENKVEVAEFIPYTAIKKLTQIINT